LPVSQLLGRLRRCPHCGASFYVCWDCDRGHWYCHVNCSVRARSLSRRRAVRRYRDTDAGRLSHREAQRRYRQKKRRSGDSEIYQSSAISKASLNPMPSTSIGDSNHDSKGALATTKDQAVCIICRNIVGRLLEHRRYPRRIFKSPKMQDNFYDHSRDTS